MATSSQHRFTVDDVLGQLWSEDESDDEFVDRIGEDDVLEEVLRQAEVIDEHDIEQCARDRQLPTDISCGWGDEKNVNKVLMEFDSIPGLKCEFPEEPTPLDMFNVLFDNEMWELLCTETNRYAKNVLDTSLAKGTLKPHSRIGKWTEVTVDEMKVFVALVILMGIIKKNCLEDYWSTDETISTSFFGKMMSKDRFLLILSNLHLVDNEENTHNDDLYKVRPFLRMIQENFMKYEPERDLSFDEVVCPFKGRVRFRVYNPQKPNKFGIKLFNLCEASSGYCVGTDVYHGDTDCAKFVQVLEPSPEDDAPELFGDMTQTTKIVLGMLAKTGCIVKGHHIYMDNYYTSPELFDVLDSYDTYACGTVRPNRKEVPKIFGQVKLKQGETIFRVRENLTAIRFHDKRDVTMLSTIHQPTMVLTNKVDHRTKEPIHKPRAIVDYIQKMGGVDLADQIVQYYDVLRRCVKWWKKLFLHMLNILVVNAYILHQKYGQQQRVKRTHMSYRQALVKMLIESAPNAPRPQRSGRKPEQLSRLTERHFIQHIKPKPGAKKQRVVRDCVVCNRKKQQREGFKRKQTAYECEQCAKPMCNPECFKRFHTLKYYKVSSSGLEADASDSSGDE